MISNERRNKHQRKEPLSWPEKLQIERNYLTKPSKRSKKKNNKRENKELTISSLHPPTPAIARQATRQKKTSKQIMTAHKWQQVRWKDKNRTQLLSLTKRGKADKTEPINYIRRRGARVQKEKENKGMKIKKRYSIIKTVYANNDSTTA